MTKTVTTNLPIETNLRPELTLHLQQRLQAFGEGFRSNIALIGPLGSGKTFQVQAILNQYKTNHLIIYCPLFRESRQSFLKRFIHAILQAGMLCGTTRQVESQNLSSQAESLAHVPLNQLIDHAESDLPKTTAAIRAVETLISRRFYAEAFTQALDVIQVLVKERNRTCVIVLDEFLYLDDLKFSHAFRELGKRVMTWPFALFILTSSYPHRARAILRERLQLLFGQFELITLDVLEPQRVKYWAEDQLQDFRNAKILSKFLTEWLGAYPWYLTVFLKRLKEIAALQQVDELTETLFVQTTWDMLGSREGLLYQWCIARTDPLNASRDGAKAMEALLQIASGKRTTTEIGKETGRGRLTESLQLLVDNDLAQRHGMCWIISDPILCCWVSTVLWAQRVDALTDATSLRQQIELYLQSLWSHWMQFQELSLSDQVATLLSKFRDDTVLLDQKTGRLPRFNQFNKLTLSNSKDTYLIADGPGKRWCCSISEEPFSEQRIADFENFCRQQSPRPSKKIVVAKSGLDDNAKLLAKAVNMWVWQAKEFNILNGLYSRSGLQFDGIL